MLLHMQQLPSWLLYPESHCLQLAASCGTFYVGISSLEELRKRFIPLIQRTGNYPA